MLKSWKDFFLCNGDAFNLDIHKTNDAPCLYFTAIILPLVLELTPYVENGHHVKYIQMWRNFHFYNRAYKNSSDFQIKFFLKMSKLFHS